MAPNNRINSDVKKLRRSFLAAQLFASGYAWRYMPSKYFASAGIGITSGELERL